MSFQTVEDEIQAERRLASTVVLETAVSLDNIAEVHGRADTARNQCNIVIRP